MTEESGHAPPRAVRYGLVRPAQGRYVAGVGAALGRATHTDPVLWRVVLAVLVCFAGLGVLIYLLVWLLTPEEGDTGSPLESLLGRGQSSTSPVLTGVLGIVVVGLLAVILPRPFYLMLGGALVVVLVLLINRAQAQPAATGGAAGPAEPAAGHPPPASGESSQPAAGDAAGGTRAGDTPGPAPTAPGADHTPGAAAPAGAWTGSAPPPGARPVPTGPAYPPPPWAGYRPPFAPHGPFAGPPPPPPPPPPPRRPPERSPLAALALFTAVAVLGMLGILDLLQVAAIPVAAYLAAALAVLGAGLVVGAWWGRARVLIAVGAVLAMALPVAHAVENWESPQHVAGNFTWVPADQTELQDTYSVAFSSAVLDLRQIDPAGAEVDLTVQVVFSEMRILVPDGPAVEAVVANRFSAAEVLDQKSEGVTQETIRDPGSGDPDDGTLRLDLEAHFSSVVVTR